VLSIRRSNQAERFEIAARIADDNNSLRQWQAGEHRRAMRQRNSSGIGGALLALPVLLAVGATWAGERAGDTPEEAALTLELNTMDALENGCRLTFVMRNRLGKPIEALGLELALFAADGAVSGIVALDAGGLPDGKTRVKRFVAPEIACAEVGRVLLNDVTRCDGDGLSPAACIARISVSSRVDQEFMF
jgi:hypothetical protein